MNARLLILTSILSVSVASFACSGENDDDTSTSDEQATGSTPPMAGSSSDSSPSLPPPSNAGTAGSPSSSNPSDPSTSSSSSGGAAPSGGASSGGVPSGGASSGGAPSKPSGEVPSSAECQPGAVEETEPNDTVATATDLGNATSFCGVAGAGDVDHFTFVLPADAKSFAWGAKWKGKGKPTISITSEGVTRTSKEDPPFFPGKKYVVTLTGSADPATYAVSLTIAR